MLGWVLSSARTAASFWRAWTLAAVAAVATLVVVGAAWQIRHLLALQQQELTLPESRKATAARLTTPLLDTTNNLAERDFTATLPARPDVSRLLGELGHATTELGIVLDSIQLVERPVDSAQLSRTDVSVRLRGSYPGIKSVLVAVLDRQPAVTVAQIKMRRTAPGVGEAYIVLGSWGSAPADRQGIR